MPAVSKTQRRAAAIALHDPSKLHKRNRALAKLGSSALRDFASTKERSLPMTRNGRKSMKRRLRHA